MKKMIKSGLQGIIFFLCSVQLGMAEPLSSIELVEGEFSHKAIIELEGCRVSLERPKKDMHYLHFRHDCQQSLEEKLGVLKSLFEILVPSPEDRDNIDTLFIGRLVKTFPEFAQRVAKVASDNPDWDSQRAWKESGFSNRLVLKMMKSDDLFPELQEAFDVLSYRVQAASVEKILMAKPKNISFGTWLLDQGADPEVKLPFDALTWFQLEPIGNTISSSDCEW